jgi:integrase
VFYSHDKVTGARKSLETTDREEAKRLVVAANQSHELPMLNLAMARTYLLAKSPKMVERTWRDVMDEKEGLYRQQGEVSTLKRWRKVVRSQPFQLIHARRLVETEADHFLAVMGHRKAGNSTNKWLRILHNFALNMGWLLAPVIPKKVWPKFKVMDRRGVTEDEHQRIVALAADNPEEQTHYELLWETGGSQTDIAQLDQERVDWEQGSLLYRRLKTQNRGYEFAKVRLGDRLRAILEQLPSDGYLLPSIAKMSLENRGRMFRRRCQTLGIKGICLHCYRYSWAERARKAGMPIRAAMETLGHRSRAVHQAYAKQVEVDLLPLEYYERKKVENIIEFRQASKTTTGAAEQAPMRALAAAP